MRKTLITMLLSMIVLFAAPIHAFDEGPPVQDVEFSINFKIDGVMVSETVNELNTIHYRSDFSLVTELSYIKDSYINLYDRRDLPDSSNLDENYLLSRRETKRHYGQNVDSGYRGGVADRVGVAQSATS